MGAFDTLRLHLNLKTTRNCFPFQRAARLVHVYAVLHRGFVLTVKIFLTWHSKPGVWRKPNIYHVDLLLKVLHLKCKQEVKPSAAGFPLQLTNSPAVQTS